MDNGAGVHTFTLHDSQGQPHSYVVTEHPAGEGMELMYELLGLGAPAVLSLAGAALRSSELLGAALRALGGEGEAPSSGDATELARMVADLELDKVGAEVGRAFATGKAPALTKRILSRAFRDGKPLNIDLAYQANYSELLMAVWKVCAINRFFPVPSMSPGSPPAARAQALES